MRADARATTRLIRDAALGEFSRQGLEVPLESIARTAGVSKGTIYNRFGSREGLIESVIEDLARAEVEAVFDRAATRNSPWDALSESLIGTWQLQFAAPAINDVLTKTHLTSDSMRSICTFASSRSASLLQAAQESGDARPDLTGLDTYNLVLVVGAAARSAVPASHTERARLFSTLLRGLRN